MINHPFKHLHNETKETGFFWICYMEKDGPEFFHVTSVSSGVITLNVFSIRYVLYMSPCSLVT